MLRTRIFLILGSAVVIWLLFLLPKVVVDNDAPLSGASGGAGSAASGDPNHAAVPTEVTAKISNFRQQFEGSASNEKNAIFADSLADLYAQAGKFDSAAWYAEEASKFFNTNESWIKAGDQYYQAYSFAMEKSRQSQFAARAQGFYNKVLDSNPDNLDVKTKLAMTHLNDANPMQAIGMLREVLKANPKHEAALFNMGMLSVQSGQYERAVDWLTQLVEVNPEHTQGQLLLGMAYMNTGEKAKAKSQFEKVKLLDKDPAVQSTVDSYLKDLK